MARCTADHRDQAGRFCTTCGKRVRPQWVRDWRIWGLVAAVVVVIVGIVAATGSGDSTVSSAATCEDPSGDVDLSPSSAETGTSSSSRFDALDILDASVERVNGRFTAVIEVGSRPPDDVGPNASQSYNVYLFQPDGETLYQFDFGVSRSPLNDHDLRADGYEFGEAAQTDELGFDRGLPVSGQVLGRVDGNSVVIAVNEADLPQLPDDFFWLASTSSLTGIGDGSEFAGDACPRPYPSDDDGLVAADFAAPSEGTTTGDPAPTTTSTTSTTSTTISEPTPPSTSAATSEPCIGASACAYDNGIDFADLRRNIAAALAADHDAVSPEVDCDSPNAMPPNRVPPGQVIICVAADADGATGTIEVSPEGFGQYRIAVTDWSGP